MKYIFGILLFLISWFGFSQVSTETTKHDFGDLYPNAPSFVDIRFTNNSDKVQYLLTIDKPRDVYYIFSAKTIEPDSTIIIRFKVNDSKSGKFNYAIDVYFSEPREAITINLKGNVIKATNGGNSMTDCPDFNATPPSNGYVHFEVTIKVIDSISREPIKNAQVYLVERGELVGDYKTNNQGIIHKSIPLGYYYITAQKESYRSNFFEGYLNFRRNYVLIELTKKKVENVVDIIEDDIVIEETIPVDTAKLIEPDEVVNLVIEEPVSVEDNLALEEIPDTIFDAKYFKYSNITFILDVSTSMNSSGKMDLLKLSMIELVKTLRPNDKVSVIKYSSDVSTLLLGVSGDKKEEIIEVVRSLKTSGLTAGGNAIKAAYKISKKEYILNGNNLVIMVTDGVFNRGDKDYLKTIRNNYKAKGIIFSVVGIKTSEYITTHMKNIVAEGGGNFVRILTVEDAKLKLIKEIRRTAYKGQSI